MALVQANGQTGLCRRFLSHLEKLIVELLTGLWKGKKKREVSVDLDDSSANTKFRVWNFSGAGVVDHVREGTR